MANDEPEVVDPVDPKDPAAPADPKDPEPPQDDYRGKLNAQNRFLKEEGYEFKEGKWQKPPAAPKQDDSQPAQQSDISSKDLYALMDAKVPQEDVDEVVKAAKLLGKSVPEALKDATVQSILKTRSEHRKSADVVNTRTVRPSTKAATDTEVVTEAAKGKIPEKGSAESEQLFWARRGGRKKD